MDDGATFTLTVNLDEMEPSPLKDILLEQQAQLRQDRKAIHRAMSSWLTMCGAKNSAEMLTEAAALEMYHQFLQERKARNG